MNKNDSLRWLAAQGAKFALPYGRTKNKFELDWPNKPHTLNDAIKHSLEGNVGVLTGKHSGGIVAIDRDVKFPETCAMLGDFAKTAKIVRSNAPERGKFLYRVNGQLPPTTSWKEHPSDKHPACEFLGDNGQRHALCPPSQIDGGDYLLIDTEFGIKGISPNELDTIWRMITGGSIDKERRIREEEAEAKANTDEYVRTAKDAWTVIDIFTHFGKVKNGTTTEKGQTRIMGNGGLLINANGSQWYSHADSIGGDKIDAWCWCRWNKRLDRSNPKMFMDVINEMAEAKGIVKPTPKPKTTKNTQNDKAPKERTASAAPKSTEYLEVLSDLGYTFEMNQLDDRIEVNGLPISDGIQAEIRTRMRDLGYSRIPAVEDSYTAWAYKQCYHPVRRYLDSLTWHGTDYIGLVSDHMESSDNPIVYPDGHSEPVFHVYFKRWLIGAAERVITGKQHPMLVLVAGQGTGKSQFVRWVGSGLPDLFNEGAIKPDNKEHDRLLAIKWIWEVGELGATTKRQDVEALKDFLTRQGVTFRIPWGVNPVTKPALASFIGTVNPSTGFLTDITGNRRFTIAQVSKIDWRYARLDVNQLWAQAYHLYKNGEQSELLPEEAERQVISNKEHLIEDPYEGWIRRLCDIDPKEEGWTQTTTELTILLQNQGVRGETRVIQMRLAETLKGMGLRQHANERPRRWLGVRVKAFFDK